MDRVVLFLMAMSRDSINNHEHLRRVKKVCADIQLNESMEAYGNQEVFLYEFILLISDI